MKLTILYHDPQYGKEFHCHATLPVSNLQEAIEVVKTWPWRVREWTLKTNNS